MSLFCSLPVLTLILLQTTALPSAPPPSEAAVAKEHAAQEASGVRHPPVLVFSVAPDFSEQASKKRIAGNVEVSLVVDKDGIPQDVIVVHGLGMGLDEKAVEAVKQYRFKPATLYGLPVATKIYADVNFQLF